MHDSHSAVQLTVESEALLIFAKRENLVVNIHTDLNSQLLKELNIKPDGLLYGADGTIQVVEVFAHIGKLKAGQKKKIATDVLKLIYLKSKHPQYQTHILFVDEQCLKSAANTGWVSAAALHFKVRMSIVELPTELKVRLTQTQAKQSIAQMQGSSLAGVVA